MVTIGIDPVLISPCGMNCAICASYLAMKNDVKNMGIKMPYCTGCRPRDKRCAFLRKHCAKLANDEVTYFFECQSFPCDRFKTIDERYRSRYRMNMIENLHCIRDDGVENFLDKQQDSWKCNGCDELISCHNGLCFKCNLEKLRSKKQKYRWDE